MIVSIAPVKIFAKNVNSQKHLNHQVINVSQLTVFPGVHSAMELNVFNARIYQKNLHKIRLDV